MRTAQRQLARDEKRKRDTSVPAEMKSKNFKKLEEFEDDQDHEAGEEPLLFVDLNFGNKETKIKLYRNSDPQRLARKFAHLKKLDEETEAKLKDLLAEQLDNQIKEVEGSQ